MNTPLQAVRWAIDQNVHIISMSWVTMKKSPSLLKAVRRATRKNVLVFCSTADIGLVYGKAWPADHHASISVSASDALGRPRPQSRDHADLLVSGEDVMADGPNYIKKQTKQSISGSSVATALAAGIASLVLCLTQLVFEEGQWKKFLQKKTMLKAFAEMRDGKSRNLQPQRLFGSGFEEPESNLNSNPLVHLPPWEQILRDLAFDDMAANGDTDADTSDSP
jgi:hypothetical protein